MQKELSLILILVTEFSANYVTERFIIFSKKPVTLPYPEPREFSPRPCILFIKNHFNIIIPSTFTSYKWPLSLRFPYKNPMCNPQTLHSYHMSRPFHFSWFYHPSTGWWREQVLKFVNVRSPPLSCYIFSLKPKYHSQHYILQHPQDMSLPEYERRKFLHRTLASTAEVQSALYFFMNIILVCYGGTQIFEIWHNFKRFILYNYGVILYWILFTKHEYILLWSQIRFQKSLNTFHT